MTKCDVSHLLDEAEAGLTSAINALKKAARLAEWEDLDYYIIAHLEGWRDGDNPYDSTALPRLRERLEEEK